MGKILKSSCPKQEGLGLYYWVRSLWTCIKIVQIIAQGSKMALPQGSFVFTLTHIGKTLTLQMSSPKKHQGQSKPSFKWSLHRLGETKVCFPYLRHLIKMATMLIYGKNPLKLFFSETKGPMALGLIMQHWGNGPN